MFFQNSEIKKHCLDLVKSFFIWKSDLYQFSKLIFTARYI